MTEQSTSDQEEQILRLWTPLLLRSILAVSVFLLMMGLLLAVARPSGNYVKSFENARRGLLHQQPSVPAILRHALRGDPEAVIVVGLMVLTLVPLARVLFCFLLFLRQRDFVYVLLTAYVLISLILGVVLGRIG
jgi:uncharacterized membrane protein